jgi:NAD(P)-dependent dehydrogenase (short-subunit alcohol dehydrogenase family)
MNSKKTISNELEGKVALITGGSRGIGAAIAKRLAADGANVAITYTKGADAAASVVKEIEHAGRKAIAIQADATDADAGKAAVEKTVATFGHLDILVNNAGTAIPKTFEETTLEEMDRVLDINVRGVFIATQAALKHMKSGGRVISIWFVRGRACRCARACGLLGHEGGRKDIYSGAVQRAWEPGHHGQQCAAGSDRHGVKSRRKRVGGAAEGRYIARPLRAR